VGSAGPAAHVRVPIRIEHDHNVGRRQVESQALFKAQRTIHAQSEKVESKRGEEGGSVCTPALVEMRNMKSRLLCLKRSTITCRSFMAVAPSNLQ
jgi:hypothetical protein